VPDVYATLGTALRTTHMNWLPVFECQVSSYSTEVEFLKQIQQSLTEKAARGVLHRGENYQLQHTCTLRTIIWL